MNELQRTQRFQQLIKPNISQKELIALSEKLIAKAFRQLIDAPNVGNLLKEMGDVITVVTGLANALGVNIEDVLRLVNDSNMSKMCLNEEECIKTEKAFAEIGLETYTLHLDDCFGVYSARDQLDVIGNQYTKDKLLKPIRFAAVNKGELAKLARIEL